MFKILIDASDFEIDGYHDFSSDKISQDLGLMTTRFSSSWFLRLLSKLNTNIQC